MIEWEGGAKELYGTPFHPTNFPEPAAQYSSVPVRCTRCRRPNVLCSSGGLACAARWPPTLPFPFFLTLWHALHCCAALHECGAAPSKVKGGAVRRKDGTLLHRENKKTEKSQKRTFPSRLAGSPTGVRIPAWPQGKTRWCRPSRPNMQALVAAAADTRSQLFRNLFVPHACHLTRRDAPRDRCLESDIHGRSRNMQLVSVSHGRVCMTCHWVVCMCVCGVRVCVCGSRRQRRPELSRRAGRAGRQPCSAARSCGACVRPGSPGR